MRNVFLAWVPLIVYVLGGAVPIIFLAHKLNTAHKEAKEIREAFWTVFKPAVTELAQRTKKNPVVFFDPQKDQKFPSIYMSYDSKFHIRFVLEENGVRYGNNFLTWAELGLAQLTREREHAGLLNLQNNIRRMIESRP